MRYSIICMLGLVAAPTAAPAADLERGKTIYSQLCFNCHGPNLDGGQGPALKDEYWQHGSSPEAILEVINKGVPGSPMIPYEAIFPEADRLALRDFILSEQEGMREVVRSLYPDEFFKGKRLTPDLFDTVESLSQTPLPENLYYMPRNTKGVMRGKSKLYIREDGKYHFVIRPVGRTSIFLNGEEVHYSDQKAPKNTHINKIIDLAAGVHELEILHEERPTHSYKFYGYLQQVGGKRMALNGRSLQGNVPKIIKAGPEAKIVRKWIDGLPPRALLCLLPNQVIVAYNPVDGQVLKAWHTAEINQTPSLPDRSAKPSEIRGEEVSDFPPSGIEAKTIQFLHYETEGSHARVVSRIDGEVKILTFSPNGEQSFLISVE